MGLLDRLRGLVGGNGDEGRRAVPEDLLDLTGAALTMERLGYEPTGDAALCFAAPDSGFDASLDELRSVIDATSARETTVREDGHGYRWIVLDDESIEGLATALQFAAEEFTDSGFDDRLLAAVTAFDDDGERAYLIYSFERGRFYPFVPTGDRERDVGTEFKLRSVLADDLPIEDDESQWYPLWPDRVGAHPWE